MKYSKLTTSAFAFSVILTSLIGFETAIADSFQDNCPKGYTCFTKGGSSYGKVAGNNSNWGNLPGDWDNKAIRFYNNGRTHFNTICEGYGTGNRGICWELFIGTDASFPKDTKPSVSSNFWTRQ